MATRLTKKTLMRKTKKPGGEMTYDAMVKGLGVKRLPSGITTAFLRYGGRKGRRYMSLGRLGPTFSLEDARKLATETLGAVARGLDPVTERAKEKAAAITFASWVQTYLQRTTRMRKRKAEPAAYLATAVAKWGRRGLDTITRSDVLNLRDEVAEEAATKAKERRARKAKVPGVKVDREDHPYDGHPTANRWLAHTGAAFAAACEEGTLASNPALRIKPLPENPPRARVLSDEEMGRLLEALENEDPFTACAFHVLIESGCRVSELLRSRWSDIDLEARVWRLPSPKAGHPQVIPLAGVTTARLKELQKLGVSEFVVPSRSDPEKARFDLREDWMRIRAKAKIGDDAHLHDLRRSYGLAVARGSGLHVASRLLRHASVTVTASTYSPLDLGMQRQATEARAKLLDFPKKKGAAK